MMRLADCTQCLKLYQALMPDHTLMHLHRPKVCAPERTRSAEAGSVVFSLLFESWLSADWYSPACRSFYDAFESELLGQSVQQLARSPASTLVQVVAAFGSPHHKHRELLLT
jgi:hypothetical protein